MAKVVPIGSIRMTQSVFDAAKFVEFDLERGEIHSSGSERLALVPIDVLASLSPGDRLDKAARAWGKNHGLKLLEAIEGDSESAEIGSLAEHLGGTVAALGLGNVVVEIQGDALMFRVILSEDGSENPGCAALCGSFIVGYLDALGENTFSVLKVADDSKGQLYWVGNSKAVSRVRLWIEDGVDPLAAIGRL